MKNREVAFCGLICEGCDIMKASSDRKIAKRISEWFKKEMDEEVKVDDIHCEGCWGERERHWSPDCWILKCCMDKRGLNYCFECRKFPCKELIKWSEKNEKYGEALERLREMVKNK